MVGSVLGLVREGTVRRIDLRKNTITVALNMTKSDATPAVEFDMPIPAAWTGPQGEFSGGCPIVGTTIWVAQSQGGRWAPLNYVPSNDTLSPSGAIRPSGFGKDVMKALRPGRWLTQVKNNIRIFADPQLGIQAGSPKEFIHLDPNKSISSNNFENQYSFSEGHRKITGIIKRDLSSNSTRNLSGSSLTSHVYDESLTEIGLDPKTKTGSAFNRNPPFIENRELTYEFPQSFGFTNDEIEKSIFDDEEVDENEPRFNRRTSRADALSLSLVFPNHLIETIKGTTVDLFGNIIDLNRNRLPSGSLDKLSLSEAETDKSEVFSALREQARKSIAFHFEINSRKDVEIPDVTDKSDFARNRSRFFVDIDKEGQFKLNVPASSESGNVPLLTRYENFSTLEAVEDESVNPNALVRNEENQDIFPEQFGNGVIKLKGEEGAGFSVPNDRFSEEPIKLGTVYHNILDTADLHQRNSPLNFFFQNSKLNNITPLDDIVSDEITISGPNANAGGRSGTLNLDGFISLNIGANTVDRQSMWLDTAGGIVSNVGRDRNNRSLVSQFDGDVFVQIGGSTISGDSRFIDLNNGQRDGALDIRVVANAQMHVIRIDNTGVRVETPGEVDLVSEQTMRFKSVRGDILFDAESIYFYANERGAGRWVQKNPGQTI